MAGLYRKGKWNTEKANSLRQSLSFALNDYLCHFNIAPQEKLSALMNFEFDVREAKRRLLAEARADNKVKPKRARRYA